ncbi:MAG: type II toxin-antitoxin system VapC family toxin [Thermoguttaceae bacterium]
MNHVFLDTVGMIAVWDDTDQWHAAAHAAYRELLAQGRRLVATSLVLCECGNAAARRPYRTDVNELRKFLIQEQLIMDPAPEEVDEAWRAYDRGEAGEAGIVDHISFVVMRRLGLTHAFTNDRHFQAAGFTILF